MIIKNNFEYNCYIKIETNSKGHKTTVDLYDGVTSRKWMILQKSPYMHIPASGIKLKLKNQIVRNTEND